MSRVLSRRSSSRSRRDLQQAKLSPDCERPRVIEPSSIFTAEVNSWTVLQDRSNENTNFCCLLKINTRPASPKKSRSTLMNWNFTTVYRVLQFVYVVFSVDDNNTSMCNNKPILYKLLVLTNLCANYVAHLIHKINYPKVSLNNGIYSGFSVGLEITSIDCHRIKSN